MGGVYGIGRSNLVDLVHSRLPEGYASKTVLDTAFQTLFAVIRDELIGGGKITLPDWGALEVIQAKERPGISPSTKKPIIIPAKKKVRFRIGKGFDTLLNAASIPAPKKKK